MPWTRCGAVRGLRGVFGRAAGADQGFPYSAALKSSHLRWDESSLDRWLADPEVLVPGNDMAFRASKAEERAEIVAYLKSLSAHAAEVSQNGFQVVAWSQDGMTYWAVSDISLGELKQFASLYRD